MTIAFHGSQLVGYKGIFSGLDVSLSINLNYVKISQNEYNVTVYEVGKGYNSSLGISETVKGSYYYLIDLNNDTLSIKYYSYNYSNVFVLYPFYMPYNFNKNSSVYVVIDVMNLSDNKVTFQVMSYGNITINNGIISLRFSDLNLTSIPVYYESQYIIYKNGFINYIQSNYSNSGEVFLETTLTISPPNTYSNTSLFILIPILVIVVIIFFLYTRKKRH
ncbi:hypothetical protein BFU36_08500 [Sulfolobus sp. A20]|nr:hypothetical protein BFU36_08500 [Sulfolobus sp. A20]TRM77891.1 hypothetical protein DJ532_03105 [Sulfolobus sp. A20-N-F8]TRM85074.1 hypothetical protein DJ522_02205 [Sulfolobus sp. F3]TRM86480.1 hypothetical protein DJ529_11230 [Sulfolobus sp. C3]TRM92500.1 hypothetical protein DJ526_05805 [Sulfolobus sp. A20-N-G8]TRM97963.1 hypothetical protein DMP16_00845 [Sulfolobus sp. B1]TRM98451.1 hypothetical protein DJ527_10545 [Sulfolobus sp. F1]TRN02194.1 hypothetical protein DJ530_04685 [Sulfo